MRVLPMKKRIEIRRSILKAQVESSMSVKQPTDSVGYEDRKVYLPHLNLPKFDGDVTRFREFLDQFEVSVYQQVDLSNATKLVYFRGCLITIEYGVALDALRGLSTANQGYELAVQRLKERFDRPLVAEIEGMKVSSKSESDALDPEKRFREELLYDGNRYSVRLLWRKNEWNLPDNFAVAKADSRHSNDGWPESHHDGACILPFCRATSRMWAVPSSHAAILQIAIMLCKPSCLDELYWERLVQSVKTALKATLGQCLASPDELCVVEARMNDRPLTFVGSDVQMSREMYRCTEGDGFDSGPLPHLPKLSGIP
ncbi:something about silencing protein 10 [Trichinella spiralis]|uniref:something about silencing protein 10 n=1 Tax=Trichinella spiralis TaxID=6334 RepID=UPI0001EFED1D|nr:something about silencing protein 10 [Trichinella spiralis]